jgi:hypothetical protein
MWQSRKSCAVVGQVHSWKLRGVVISHSFAFRASRRLNFSYKSILPCTAFLSTFVNMLQLSPPLPVLLLLRVGGLSRLNTRAIHTIFTFVLVSRIATFDSIGIYSPILTSRGNKIGRIFYLDTTLAGKGLMASKPNFLISTIPFWSIFWVTL